jgi:HSP20 family protein
MTPWRERFPITFSRFENEMERLMDRFFRSDEEWHPSTRHFLPKLDMVESESQFEVKVDLPGITPEQVHVDVKRGELWITGEIEEEHEEEGKTYHRLERRRGEFQRVLPLPENVNEEGIEATFQDGVLSIVVPKTEEARPRHIEVKA